jgi:putative heme-binding domain-containing protein
MKAVPYTLGLEMGARAAERAKEREIEVGATSPLTGKAWNAVEYLYECIAEPDSHVVETFSPGVMPVVYKPPIGLNEEEVKAVIAYMVSLGGEDTDMDYLMSHSLPKKVLDEMATAAKGVPFKLYFEGDAEIGEEIFWDPDNEAACSKCHSVNDKGGDGGPDLTNIAATQPINYILESILDPSAVIVNGYETVLIVTKDGRYIDGIDRGEDGEFYSILNAEGEIIRVPLSEIEEVAPQSTSIMPGNLRELITVEDFHNILAYVLTLTGDEEGESETVETAERPEEGGA